MKRALLILSFLTIACQTSNSSAVDPETANHQAAAELSKTMSDLETWLSNNSNSSDTTVTQNRENVSQALAQARSVLNEHGTESMQQTNQALQNLQKQVDPDDDSDDGAWIIFLILFIVLLA